MNDRDRTAWAKSLGSALLPSPTGESSLIVIPGRGPSKANTYEVHFDQNLWDQIGGSVAIWKKKAGKKPFWVAPSQAVKDYEAWVNYHVTTSEKFRLDGPLALEIAIFGSRLDVDNQVKAIQDGIQQSGIIKNDNQFTRLEVEKHPGDPRVELKMRKR